MELSLVFETWGEAQGYVSVPRRKGDRWEDNIFQWPREKGLIQDYLERSVSDGFDTYWCLTVLKEPRRKKYNVFDKVDILWSDLDYADPRQVKPKPTIAWETSPGRYSCLWKLDKPIKKETVERLNKMLAYQAGADPSGWDLTQVLRVPGTPNHKYDKAPLGKVLWAKDSTVKVKPLLRMVRKEKEDKRKVEFTYSADEDFREIVQRYKDKLPKRVYELLLFPDSSIEVGDRSDRLWELECMLAEAGLAPEDIFIVVKSSPWNKFSGRNDEDEQLQREIEKAVKKTGFVYQTTETGQIVKAPILTSYADIMGTTMSNPGWLVKDIWQNGSHGMIAGEPKTYKSFVSMDLAVAVASGLPFLGKFEVHNPGPVLIIQQENDPWTVQDRLKKIANHKGLLKGRITREKRGYAVLFPPDLPIYLLNNYSMDLTDSDTRKYLENQIAAIKPHLVIFDPLYLLLGGVDENSAKELRPVLSWLLDIRYKYKTSIVVVHHWNKGGASNRGGQRMLGSAILHGWVESAMYMSVVTDEDGDESGTIQMEREFRSFPKPSKAEIEFNVGEPGTLQYMPTVTVNKTKKIPDLREVFDGTSGSLSKEDILRKTKWSKAKFKKVMKKAGHMGLIKTHKNSYSTLYSLDYEVLNRVEEEEENES